jgi:ribose transport system permease protein
VRIDHRHRRRVRPCPPDGRHACRAAQVISNGSAQGYTGSDPVYTFLAQGSILFIPTLIWILILVAVLVWILLRFTILGRNIYAVGGNDAAARLSGISVNRIIVFCFVLSGLSAALAGILLTARTGSG